MIAPLNLTLAFMAAMQAPAPPDPDPEPPGFGEIRLGARLEAQSAERELDDALREAIAAARLNYQGRDEAADRRASYEAVLNDAQRGWLLYRDAQCTLEGYWARGGSMEGLLYSQCIARLTRERIAQLRQSDPIAE